jgi:DNA-binding transcriptional ArsR family regulator
MLGSKLNQSPRLRICHSPISSRTLTETPDNEFMSPSVPESRSFSVDAFDPLVVNPGRLRILTALATVPDEAQPALDFIELRRRTRLTDGNLASHARRLAEGGLIGVSKYFREGKPVTTYMLSDAGRIALHGHVRKLVASVQPPATAMELKPPTNVATRTLVTDHDDTEDDWVD